MKKRKVRTDGSFFICLAINMLLNMDGLIPAAILLGLHFLFGWSVLWSIGAFVLWIIGLVIFMLFMGWACSSSNVPDQSNIKVKPYIVGESGKTSGGKARKEHETMKQGKPESGQHEIKNILDE